MHDFANPFFSFTSNFMELACYRCHVWCWYMLTMWVWTNFHVQTVHWMLFLCWFELIRTLKYCVWLWIHYRINPVWGESTAVSIVSCQCAYCCPEPVHGKKFDNIHFFLSWHCAMCKGVNCYTMSWAWRKTASHRVKLLYRIGSVWSDLVLVKALT